MHAKSSVENSAALGSWYASRQQFGCAIDVFQSGLKSNGQSAQLHYLLGISLAAAKRPNEAVAELGKSAAIEPQEIRPHLVLGSLYGEMKKPDDAEREWRKALAIDPRSEPALEGLTAILMAREDYAGVIQVLGNAPRTEQLSISLARAFGLLNYPDQAEKVLVEAMQAHPDSRPLQQATIIALVKERKFEDAIKLARSVVEKHPGDVDAEIDYFRLLVKRSHFDEAAPLGTRLVTERPMDPEVLFLDALVRRGLGDNGQAKADLERAVTLDPNSSRTRYELGNTLVQMREWPEAKLHLEKAIDLGAKDPEVHIALAKALRGLGETDRATEETKKYQQMKKDDETRLEAAESIAQGDAALEAGNASDAVTRYKEALEGQPDNANYHYKLAIALARAGDTAGERQELEQAIKLDPKLPGPQNELGYLLSRSGDADGAVQHFQQAVQAAPAWPEAWINLAAELAVTRRFSEARQAVAKALELDPKNQAAQELSDQLARDPAAQQDHP
jgi:Flp pilus assembly protein TadD